MQSIIVSGLVACVVVFALGCGGEDDPSGAGGQGADGGNGGAGASGGAAGSGGDSGGESSGGSGGSGGCFSCAEAMTAIENGQSGGKICEEPPSTPLFIDLAQCYCGETVCGGAAGACVAVCDPEPDPDVSDACVNCIVDSFSGACQAEAQACSADT